MRLGVIDVETSYIRAGSRPRTKLWGVAIEGRGYFKFADTDSMVNFISKQDDVRLYHHHDYDPCQCIVDKVIPNKIKLRGSRIIRSEVGGKEWINSFALFPDKLQKILESCGYKKLAMEADGHPKGCECNACFQALQTRNESDCRDALSSFIQLGAEYANECGVNPVRDGYSTAASAAFAAAEKEAGSLPVMLENREAYRGGRTEAFRLGVLGEAACWDIHSSYPYSFVDLPPSDWMIRAEISVKPDDGPMPYFMENNRDDGLLFPAGKFTTWFFASNYERYIKPHGNIKSLRILEKRYVDMTWLKRVAPMLQRLYRIRMTAGEGKKYALKIAINSVYGRLGMRPYRMVCQRSSTLPDGDVTYFRIGHNDYLAFREIYSKPKANYAYAAAITDNARARLYDMARKLGNVFYMDTDSVYIPANARFPVSDSEEMGAWGFVGKGPLRVRTVKDYEFAGMEKLKGGKGGTQWTARLALGREPVRMVQKTQRAEYDKRRVLRGGFTAPLMV